MSEPTKEERQYAKAVELYVDGRHAKAAKWFRKAADQGDTYAQSRLKNMEAKMSELDSMDIPTTSSGWRHRESGALYRVIAVANENADRDGWPVTVVYEDKNLYIWSRPLTEWHEKMERTYASRANEQ